MRFTLVLSAFGWTMLGSGCALVEDTGRNALVSVGRCVEERNECKRNRQWANQTWEQVAQIGMYSHEHADGFKEGYAEYLYRGGNGEPPLVAPTRFRRIAYQSPDGHRAVQDWFAGYRHGAAVAQAQGVREWVTGPSALSPEIPITASQEATVVRTMVRVYHKPGPPKPPTTATPAETAAKQSVPAAHVSTAVPLPVDNIPGINLPASHVAATLAEAKLPEIPAWPSWPAPGSDPTAATAPVMPTLPSQPPSIPTETPLPQAPVANALSSPTSSTEAPLPPLPSLPTPAPASSRAALGQPN